MAPGHGARREHARAQPQLAGHPGTLVVEVDGGAVLPRRQVPLVEHERRRASLLHRHLGDAQILGGDARRGVADDERDLGASRRPPRAQGGVVLERLPDLAAAAQPGGVDEDQVAGLAAGSPASSSGRSMASRVVPATSGETITRSEPSRRLTSEDLPTFGRPSRARRTSSPAVASTSGEERDDAVEQVAGAEALGRGDRHRLAEPEAVELGGQRQVSDAVALVRRHDDRAPGRGAGGRRSPRPPAAGRRGRRRRASRPRRRPARRGPARGSSRASPAPSARSTPPVSMSANVRPFHSAGSSLRSRVTPATSWTTASRVPLRRLTSEDFPTFG